MAVHNKDLLYSTENSAQCHVTAWMGEKSGENGHMYIRMAESLHCPPETITALLIGYTPVKNKNVRKVFAPVKVPVFFNMNV